jgi:hypothetical protein
MIALRFLRTIHGWIGVLVISWVLLFGLTGACLWTIPRLMRSKARRTGGRMSHG